MGYDQNKKCLLVSSNTGIHPTVCKSGEDGRVEVPVVNRGVLQTGQSLSSWEEKSEEWEEASPRDFSTDLISAPRRPLPKQTRLSTLKMALAENKSSEVIPVEEKRQPKVGSRGFMKLPQEKSRSKHLKLTSWDGPFHVLQESDASALISRV